MAFLNLQSLRPTKGTATKIQNFLFTNKEVLTNNQKDFYSTVQSMVHRELSKPAKYRASMKDLCERAYHIEDYILRSGAVSVLQIRC